MRPLVPLRCRLLLKFVSLGKVCMGSSGSRGQLAAGFIFLGGNVNLLWACSF
jgi:hypothetical protein